MSVFDYEHISDDLKAVKQLLFALSESDTDANFGPAGNALFFLAETLEKAAEDTEALFDAAVELSRKQNAGDENSTKE